LITSALIATLLVQKPDGFFHPVFFSSEQTPIIRALQSAASFMSDSPFKSKGGLGRLFNALRYSGQGLAAALRHEAAFRQELALAVVLTPLAFWLGQTPAEILVLLGTLVFVLVVELLNSALEALADTITLEHHPLIGRAKDLASAAVLLSLIFAGAVWLSFLYSRLLS
jgi:diacylglycerol kinase (ATP)